MFKEIISFIGFTAILAQGSIVMSSGLANAAPQSTYGVITAGHSRKCFDVPNGSMGDNIGIVQFQCNNSSEQTFTTVDVGGGYYTIISGHSGKCLDVPNGSMDDNIGINQYQCDNSPEQSFSLKPIGNDYYNVVARHSGKCINVLNKSMNDNAAITQLQCNGQQEQMFWFSALPSANTVQSTQQQPQQQLAQQQTQQQQTQQKIQTGGAISRLTEMFSVNADTQTVAISPNNQRMASGGWDNQLTVWDTSGPTLVKALTIPLRGRGDLLLDTAFSPDSKRIVTGSRQNGATLETTVHVWDAYSGTELLILQGAPSEFCRSVAYDPRGLYIAAGCFNLTNGKSTLFIWNANTGVQLLNIDGISGPVAFSPDGKRLAGGDANAQTLKVFDMDTGNALLTLQGSGVSGFRSVTFNANSTSILTGNGNGTMTLWNTATGQEIITFFAHTNAVNDVAFSSDNSRFISASEDGTLILWDGNSGQKLSTFNSAKALRSVSISADNKHIVTGGDDNILRIFADGAVASTSQSGTQTTLVQQQLAQQQLQQQRLTQQQTSIANTNNLPVTQSSRAYLLYNDTANKLFFDTYDPTRGTWMPISLDPHMQIEVVGMATGSGGLQVRIETQGKGYNQYGIEVGGSYRLYANPQTGMWDVSTTQAPTAATLAAIQNQQQQLAQQTQQQQVQQQQVQQQQGQQQQGQQQQGQQQQGQQQQAQQQQAQQQQGQQQHANDPYMQAHIDAEKRKLEKYTQQSLPAMVALHIDYIDVKMVSTGKDQYTSALFNTLDIAVSKIGSKAAGIGGSLTVGLLRSQGISFDDLNKSSFAAGDDDLFIQLDGITQWPQAYHNALSIPVHSGQHLDIQMSWNVATNKQHYIELKERDTGSGNDLLGAFALPKDLRPGYKEEFILHNTKEGSLYVVGVHVTKRLASEKNGWAKSSLWINNTAYCFPQFGCTD